MSIVVLDCLLALFVFGVFVNPDFSRCYFSKLRVPDLHLLGLG